MPPNGTYHQYCAWLRERPPAHEDAYPLDTPVRVNTVPFFDGIVYAYQGLTKSRLEQWYLIQPVGETMVMVHEPHHLLEPIPAMQARLF